MVNKQLVFVLIFFLSFTLLPNEVLAEGTDSARERMIYKDSKKDMIASREAIIKERKDDFREKMQLKREEAQEKFQAKREAFQQKVATIKDERKRQLVETISSKLSTVNTNRTNQMTENLEKLSDILAKIQEKATTAKADGNNTTNVDTAIAKAETAINNAKTAVVTQASKEYIITITATGSGQLKRSVGATTKQLQADLSASHKLLVAAKQAVQQAHMELSKQ